MSQKILVVDDESSIREALSKVLQAEDYEVVTAESSREAIEKLKSEKIALAVLDLGLPVRDGWRTLNWLARVNPYLPVIIITGRSNQREMAERMAVDAVVEKPIDVPRLLEMVRELTTEPMDGRIQRASVFRYLACDHDLFLKLLNERFYHSYPCPELENR
jgi:CheY-like chemotaxis protein